jgi:signal transduction histidine kinase/ActR/RegA family two-component response regulator
VKLSRALALIVACPLLVLTYLLVQGATPDAVRHERTLDALRTLTSNSAALQRDVLRARAGLLRDYDPLVRSVETLRHVIVTLSAAAEIAGGAARAEIDRKVEALAAAIDDQEELSEAFKSRNALLQNSLSFFSHSTGELSGADGARPSDIAGEIAALGNSMLRFTGAPGPEVATELTAALDRLDRLLESRDFETLGQGEGALVSHGRLIVATLPAVDDLVSRLQSAPTTERAQAVQDAYLNAYAEAAARAGFFRILLYIAAVALVAYVGFLFIKLHAYARLLETRLSFEKLIAAVSTQFINLPRDRIDEGIEGGLARLAEHVTVDCAHIIVPQSERVRAERAYSWRRKGIGAPAGRPEDLLLIAENWRVEGYEQHGCIHVPRVAALPDGLEKAHLEGIGICSWLSIPMGPADRRVGVLVLATAVTEKHWLDDDIARVRMASEIFANAIAREHGDAEREALETRLGQAQRLEAIGTLAGGIAHEFNNILGAILGYGEMALATLRKSSQAQLHVQQIMKAGRRAQGVVDQVLMFSRRRARQPRPIRAQPAVAEAIEFIRASFPATLVVEARLDAEGATMLSDPTELQQVVMNLCTNAAQAMEGRGTLTVHLSAVHASGGLTLSHGSLPAGRYIRLVVRDTGHGIERATMERIFEPFFTTKAVGDGTGLGLSTVHGIVMQQGGALNVESRPGAGTTFEVYFPQTKGDVLEEHRMPEAAVPHGHGETILFVDDERPLVALGEEMLAAIGYEPVGFETGSAALAAFHADPDRFDLVLTDEVMPGMTGTELALALHEIRPDLPIVLMTGYAGPIRSHRLQAAGIREVLKKPLLSAAISLCLARHLPARNVVPAESRH